MKGMRGVLMAAVLGLAACGQSAEDPNAGPELQARAADAPRAAVEQDERFGFLRYSIDVAGDNPRVCLVFTHPLDPEADYSAYVGLSEDISAAFDADGQTLCVGGLSFDTSLTLTLREGLPRADGEGLAEAESFNIDFGDRPAHVGFSSDGVILPRLEADGLAIETVNVETVDIRLYRITDRALAFRSITQGYTAGEGEYGYLGGDERPYDVAERIWEGQMDTPGPANAGVTTVFPVAETIGVLSPGAYFIEVTDAADRDEDDYSQPARARRWLVITDLMITAYRGADGMDFTVRSLQSAQPVRDVRVELIAQSNEVLASVETGRNGRARFEDPLVRGEQGMRPRLLTAYGPDNDFAVLDLDRSPVDLTGQDIDGRIMPDGADAYLYLDRGIYRPGETVHLNALFRDVEGRAVSDRPGELTVYGPNGIEAYQQRFDAAEAAGSVGLDYDLSRSAARGEWRVTARLDGYGQVGAVRFSVEDFVPQRIALDLDADTDTPILGGGTRAVDANVRFLYGAPGAGLPVESRLRIQRDFNPFPDLEGFRWGRHDESFREISRDMPDATADGAGQAVLRIDPAGSADNSTYPLRVRAVVSAIEPGGRAVSDDVIIPYRPNDAYLGIRPDFDGRARRNAPIAFDLAAVTPTGALTAMEIEWRLVRIDYEYDWYRLDGRWRWRRTRHVVEIEDGVASLDGETPASVSLEVRDSGSYQLIVSDPAGGQQASHGFWVGWGSRPSSGDDAPDRVRIATPDAPVAVGENAEITILPPYPGVAEVVIATDRVLETRTVDAPEEGVELSFRVSEEWGSGAYVMVNVYTPRDPVSRPTPRRAVGVAHLPVDMDERTFELSLDTPELIRPRQTVSIEVAAEGGPRREDVWLTLAAVDEGILALTRFQSPDPVDHFFGQYRLGVDLMDDYGRLLDPNQGAAAPVRQGGDQIGGAGLSVVPTRTVALWSGPVSFADGAATVELDIPDFNGELRLMAVAWSQSGLGAHAQPVTVRDEVPAEIILPRFLAPGDVSRATITIDNVEGEAGVYAAAMTATGAVEADERIEVDLAQGERRDETAPLEGGTSGIGDVALAVDGPGGFSVARDYPIEVRSAWLPASYVNRGRLAPGQAWPVSADTLAPFNPGTAEISVTFSSTPLDEAALLRSLSRYPYGCTEQTVSRALPLLYANDIAALEGLELDEEARLTIQDAVSTVLNRQGGDGAIGLWRLGDRQSSPWLGAYAVDFLARAGEAGYVVPEAAMERAYSVLEHVAAQELWRASGYDDDIYRWSGQTDTTQRLQDRSAAYALYVLARAGRADRSRLRYMHDERIDEIASPLARAHIGAALALIGDNARSRNAFDQAEAAIGFSNRGDYYQTPRRDLAGIIALAAEAGDEDRVVRLTDRLLAQLPEPNRLTTQEKAFLLLAAHALSGGETGLSIEAEGLAAPGPNASSFQIGSTGLDDGVRFTNGGDTAIWLTQIATGETVEAPEAIAEGVALRKLVRNMDGSLADLSAVSQGDRFIVHLTLSPVDEREVPAIIEDLLPAGFEIEAMLNPSDAGTRGPFSFLGTLSNPRVAEVRDDRYVAALTLQRRRSQSVAYIVRAVTPGDYAMPGATAEDMYRPDVFARTPAGRVSISER